MNKQLLAIVGLILLADAALAQSNSLYHRRAAPRSAPTSQPAAGGAVSGGFVSNNPSADLSLPLPNNPAARPRAIDPGAPVQANPVLLQYSSISVEMPAPKKLKVHDLVTVIVKEDRRQTTDAKLDSQKQWKIQSELAKFLRLDTNNHLIPQNFPTGTPGVEFNWDDQYKGTGKNERKDSLLTRITAEILDVKPNGTLVLQAGKRIKQDGDELHVTLTGTCRSEDVLADNTVLSTQLADLQIDSVSEGAARDATKRGWLKRALDALNPM